MCMFFYCYTLLAGFSLNYFFRITRDISHWYRFTLICHFSPNVFKFRLSHLIIKIKFFLFNLNEITGLDVLFIGIRLFRNIIYYINAFSNNFYKIRCIFLVSLLPSIKIPWLHFNLNFGIYIKVQDPGGRSWWSYNLILSRKVENVWAYFTISIWPIA